MNNDNNPYGKILKELDDVKEAKKAEAIAFAEWIDNELWTRDDNLKGWVGSEGKYKTTDELYSKFKNKL